MTDHPRHHVCGAQAAARGALVRFRPSRHELPDNGSTQVGQVPPALVIECVDGVDPHGEPIGVRWSASFTPRRTGPARALIEPGRTCPDHRPMDGTRGPGGIGLGVGAPAGVGPKGETRSLADDHVGRMVVLA